MDGSKIFVDSSLIEANAGHSSVIDTHSLHAKLHARYAELEQRLTEGAATEQSPRGAVNRRALTAGLFGRDLVDSASKCHVHRQVLGGVHVSRTPAAIVCQIPESRCWGYQKRMPGVTSGDRGLPSQVPAYTASGRH